MDPLNIPAKFEVRRFTRWWDNRVYWKNLGRPWTRPHSLFWQIFNRLLLAWTLWIHLPNLKFVVFVALRVPEIKGGTGQIAWWRHLWRHEACIDYPHGSFGRTMQWMFLLKYGRIPTRTVEDIACWRLWCPDCDVIGSRDVIGEVTIR